MKVLLTGADGFTGRYIKLLSGSLNFFIISLKSNLLDFNALSIEIDNYDFDYVIHLAAISVSSFNNQDLYENGNVIATENLLKSLLNKKNLKKIIIASSASIYGGSNGIVSENSKPNPLSLYAKSKLNMENMVLDKYFELPIIITRPFNYTGIGQTDFFVVPKIINHFINKKNEITLGNINVKREINDVRYVAEIYLKLLNISKSRLIVNICTGQTYSIKEIVLLVTEITNKNININIDDKLLRPNDPELLFGDNSFLLSLVNFKNQINIRDTLRWMLNV